MLSLFEDDVDKDALAHQNKEEPTVAIIQPSSRKSHHHRRIRHKSMDDLTTGITVLPNDVVGPANTQLPQQQSQDEAVMEHRGRRRKRLLHLGNRHTSQPSRRSRLSTSADGRVIHNVKMDNLR